MFWVIERNFVAGVQLLSLDTHSIHLLRHFFCNFSTEAINSIVKFLRVFINFLLKFLTKLLVKR